MLPAVYRKASPKVPEFLSAPYISARTNRLIFPYRTPPLLFRAHKEFLYFSSMERYSELVPHSLDMTELRYSSKILLCASTKVSNLKLSSTIFIPDLILLVPLYCPKRVITNKRLADGNFEFQNQLRVSTFMQLNHVYRTIYVLMFGVSQKSILRIEYEFIDRNSFSTF